MESTAKISSNLSHKLYATRFHQLYNLLSSIINFTSKKIEKIKRNGSECVVNETVYYSSGETVMVQKSFLQPLNSRCEISRRFLIINTKWSHKQCHYPLSSAYRLNLSNSLKPEEAVNLVNGCWTELDLIAQVLCLLKVAPGCLWLNSFLSVSLAKLNCSCYLDRNYPEASLLIYNLYGRSAAFNYQYRYPLHCHDVLEEWIR